MSSSRLKVLTIAHSAHSDGSGRLRYRPLAQNGKVELVLVIPERWGEVETNKPADPVVPPLDIRPRPINIPYVKGVKWYAHWYPRLGSLIRDFSPDVLHLWEEPWSVVALQATRLRNRYAPQCALILETEQNIQHRLPFPFERIRRYTLQQADWLISRSEEAAQVSQACGFKKGYTLVDYCVDRTHFHPKEPLETNKKTGDAATREGLRVGYVGRLVKIKGLFTVLEALRLSRPDVLFTLVGDGPSRTELESKVIALGLQDRVQFVPSQPAQEVARFMHSVDVLVLMSETTATWKEQFGRVIIEAQGCGTPVIGSTSGAIPSVVGDGGWIIQEGDSAALSRLFDTLALDPEMVEAARLKALQNVARYTPEAISARLLSAYEEAAMNRRTGRYSAAQPTQR